MSSPAEEDARRRGTWYFEVNFAATKPVKGGEETIAGGWFEVLQFAQDFKDFEYYEEGEDHQVDWEPPSIYNKLDRIRNGEIMAFVKLKDHQSVKLAELRQQHQPIKYFTFNLKKFSRRGGVIAEFTLELQSVFILDIVQAGAAERYLITFSDARLHGSMPSKSN